MEQLIKLLEQYRSLNLSQVVDYDKFNHFAITHHSTHLEGSTLTQIETQLLLDEDLTPKGKPLTHSLMVKDHYQALQFILEQARQKTAPDVPFIKKINALVLKNTGTTYKTLLGDVDSSQGEYRLSNVRAGNRYFANYAKVAGLTAQLSKKLIQQMQEVDAVEAQLTLSFDAHFDLVSIHPFYDGNGRTARLLMNYIQARFDLPLAIVFSEDKAAYFEALEKTRELEDMAPFRQFMCSQYEQYLREEIKKYLEAQANPSKGGRFSLVF